MMISKLKLVLLICFFTTSYLSFSSDPATSKTSLWALILTDSKWGTLDHARYEKFEVELADTETTKSLRTKVAEKLGGNPTCLVTPRGPYFLVSETTLPRAAFSRVARAETDSRISLTAYPCPSDDAFAYPYIQINK